MPFDFELAIIGAGPAGISAAAAAHRAEPNARIALLEAHRAGGPRLWSGSVAIGALARSARAFELIKRSEEFGIHSEKPRVVWTAVRMRIAAVRDEVRERDRAAIHSSGATLIPGRARFLDPHTLEITGAKEPRTLRAAKFILATGRAPLKLHLDGLEETGFLTPESLIDRPNMPHSLVFLGYGPATCELAQAFRHFGASVTVITPTPALVPNEEPVLIAALERYLRNEGIAIHLNARATRVRSGESGKIVDFTDNEDHSQEAKGTEVVVVPEAAPDLGELALESAGVTLENGRPAVDQYLRTLSSHIWAAGSVLGRRGTGSYQGAIAGHNAFAEQPREAHADLLPHVIHTDPALARIGPTEHEAQEAGETVSAHAAQFNQQEKALIEGDDFGFARLLTNRDGVIIGAQAVCPGASELVAPCATWVGGGMKLAELAELPVSRPSLADAWVRAAEPG